MFRQAKNSSHRLKWDEWTWNDGYVFGSMVRRRAGWLSTRPSMFHVKQRGVELVSRIRSTAATFILVIPFWDPEVKMMAMVPELATVKCHVTCVGAGHPGNRKCCLISDSLALFCRITEGVG
jgi:hypothetical protein